MMNPLDSTEILVSLLYTAPILVCVFVANLFLVIFRLYQARLPLHQNRLNNVLFSHLSIILQATNVVTATFLMTHFVFILDWPLFSCVLHHFRRFHIIMSLICVFLLSVSRSFAHFKPEYYSRIQHTWIGKLSAIIMVFAFICFSSLTAINCDLSEICSVRDECYNELMLRLICTVLILITFFNGIIFIDFFFEEYFSLAGLLASFKLPHLVPFHGLVPPISTMVRTPTLSQDIQMYASSHSNSSSQVAWTAGLITILVSTTASGILIKVLNIFSIPIASYLGAIFVLLLTTGIPVFWIGANENMREFAKRKLTFG